MADLTILQKPFETVRQREGAGGKRFTYVAGADVIDRILQATESVYDWEIIDIRFIEGQSRLNRKTEELYQTPGSWMVHGRLTIRGLGTRDGIGTAVAENEESPKSAETDALKRAAVKFGVALHLYKADESHGDDGGGRQRRQAVTSEKCGHCGTTNQYHAANCPKRV